jgi:hypothetical protein
MEKFDIGFDLDEDVWTFEPTLKATNNTQTVNYKPVSGETLLKCENVTITPSLNSDIMSAALSIPYSYKIVMTEVPENLNDKSDNKDKWTKNAPNHECLIIHDEIILDLKYYTDGNDMKIVGDIVPANGYNPGQISLESVNKGESKLVYTNHDRVVSMPICDGYDLYLLMKYWFETAETDHLAETVIYQRTK